MADEMIARADYWSLMETYVEPDLHDLVPYADVEPQMALKMLEVRRAVLDRVYEIRMAAADAKVARAEGQKRRAAAEAERRRLPGYQDQVALLALEGAAERAEIQAANCAARAEHYQLEIIALMLSLRRGPVAVEEAK